jgi:hypothetical protein
LIQPKEWGKNPTPDNPTKSYIANSCFLYQTIFQFSPLMAFKKFVETHKEDREGSYPKVFFSFLLFLFGEMETMGRVASS